MAFLNKLNGILTSANQKQGLNNFFEKFGKLQKKHFNPWIFPSVTPSVLL